MTFRSAGRPHWRDDSGQALVEIALSLPLLLAVVFGIAQFGITYNNYIMLTDAVRAGARQLSISRGQTNACTKARDRIYGSAASLSSGSLSITMTVAGGTYGYPGTSCPSNIGTSMTGGADVTISATYPCGLTIFGVNYAPGCTLSSQSTVRIE
ncbi:MAG: pilus assembly protein [Acidobacteria bacterium]|nr:pilus assembly protein [Acidobacteriota bacterium]